MRCLAVVLLCLVPLAAEAKQSPYPPATQFSGDRYTSTAQMAADVVRAVRIQRKAKRQRRPVVRRLALAEGMIREVGRALGRPRAWCGWWLGHHLGMPLRRLWLARNWASVGTRASPAPGVVVVWPHHVGIITGRRGTQWVVKSGNDGHRVRERARSIAGAIAFRRV